MLSLTMFYMILFGKPVDVYHSLRKADRIYNVVSGKTRNRAFN